jgi:glyoxylase-like metal-dependent hydrolase (beta-lactamase superfamily II)
VSASAERLPDAAGYETWLLGCGSLHFGHGVLLPHRECDVAVNALLLRGHGEVLLIDCGSGVVDHWLPGGALLDEAFVAAGADPGEVTCLVLTHLDLDHAGGALVGTWPGDLAPRFPRTVILDEAVDWWLGRTDEENLGGPLIRIVDPVRIPAGEEIAPGLRYLEAPGHRPGHAAVLIGDDLIHAADILHIEDHVQHPEWDHVFDHDVVAALETRLAWLHRLEASGTPVVFSHLAGRGRIAPGRRWEVLRS